MGRAETSPTNTHTHAHPLDARTMKKSYFVKNVGKEMGAGNTFNLLLLLPRPHGNGTYGLSHCAVLAGWGEGGVGSSKPKGPELSLF